MSKYKEDIIRLRKQGKTYREIEDELGCSRGNISYHCKNEGLEDIGKKQKEIEEKTKKKIKEHYKNHTREETANRFDVSESTVQKYGEAKKENQYDYEDEPTKNTTIKGDASEALVTAKYIQKGYGVSAPVNDGLPYDLIVDKNGELHKVQVKRGKEKNGGLKFPCSTNTRGKKRRPYKRGEVDIFAIHNPNTGEIYEVPYKETPKMAMKLRLEEPKSKQKTINLAADYEI